MPLNILPKTWQAPKNKKKLQNGGRFKAVHTVYRNIQVIKQGTIKQYLIVANTCQHLQHFRIVKSALPGLS